MKNSKFAVLLFALSLAACSAKKNEPAPVEAKQSTPPSPEEMEKAMKVASTRTEFHDALEPLVGKWKVTSKMWMEPGKDPQVSTGTADSKWILDNHYIQEDFSGDFMGKPFKGVSINAYNTVGKEYQSTWIDSMNTQIMVNNGQISPDKKQITYSGKFDCPMMGSDTEMTSVLTIVDKDKHTFEMFGPGPDGKQMKSFELIYERAMPKKMGKKA
jgi:hypothetical protein